MAFTDLEEHLEEVFGEQAPTVDRFDGFAWHHDSDKAKRTKDGYARKVHAKHLRERAKSKVRRREALLEAFVSGERPHRCQRAECCNLLVPKPGSVVRTCSAVCRTVLWRSARPHLLAERRVHNGNYVRKSLAVRTTP